MAIVAWVKASPMDMTRHVYPGSKLSHNMSLKIWELQFLTLGAWYSLVALCESRPLENC